MSEKGSGAVRVGCGTYEWSFRPPDLVLIENLRITIERMQSLPAHTRAGVMAWLSKLPYPWCTPRVAVESIPPFEELRVIAERLSLVPESA
jgi:hypothetical protein